MGFEEINKMVEPVTAGIAATVLPIMGKYFVRKASGLVKNTLLENKDLAGENFLVHLHLFLLCKIRISKDFSLLETH